MMTDELIRAIVQEKRREAVQAGRRREAESLTARPVTAGVSLIGLWRALDRALSTGTVALRQGHTGPAGGRPTRKEA